MRIPPRAKGTDDDNGNKVIAVRFTPDVFEQIADAAEINGISFAEQVRIYVGRGMGGEGQ